MFFYLSYILQPLNVICFSVFKRMYNTQIEARINAKIQYINKENFLEMYFIVH